MPSTVLTDLAPELFIQILKSSESFADVTSFSSTSRKMFVIWKTNLDAICEAILPRTIDCFEEAQELLAAQERAEGEKHAVAGYRTALDRAKWMLEGADTAAIARRCFENCVIHCGNQQNFSSTWGIYPPKRTVLTPNQCMDFLRAYYRAKTLATLAKGPLPYDMLSSWDMLAFGQMKDAMTWLMMGDLDPNLHHCDAYNMSRGVMIGEDWPLIYDKIRALHEDIIDLPFSSNLEVITSASISFYGFLFYDFHQKSTNSNRGARLSDLLPLVRDGGYHYYNNMYELSNP